MIMRIKFVTFSRLSLMSTDEKNGQAQSRRMRSDESLIENKDCQQSQSLNLSYNSRSVTL